MFSGVELDREISSRRDGGLHHFVRKAWKNVEPKDFIPNWHLEVMCDRLQAVVAREIRGLIINVPPGTSKSLICSTLFPAWVWTQHPSATFLTGSYADDISLRDARRSKKLIESPWYHERWRDIALDPEASAVGHFYNTKRGFRYSTSVRGGGTGHHADFILVDDPIKAMETMESASLTRAAIEAAKNWYKSTLSMRWSWGFVLVMQRLHEDDLAGYLIDEVIEELGGFEVIRFPMRYEARDASPYDRRTREGELLYPELHPEKKVRPLELVNGPDWVASQYQQRPVAAGGGIFKEAWFETEYRSLPSANDDDAEWIIYVDCNFLKAAGSDRVAAGVLARRGPFVDVADVRCAILSFTETCDMVLELARLWPQVHAVYVEKAANGPAVVDALRNRIAGIQLDPPEGEPLPGSKEGRAHAVSGVFASGHVRLPARAPWKAELIAEMTRFPRARYDDQVDMMTGGVRRLVHGSDSRYQSFLEEISRELGYTDAAA